MSPPVTSPTARASQSESSVPARAVAIANSATRRRFLPRLLNIAPLALSRACINEDPV